MNMELWKAFDLLLICGLCICVEVHGKFSVNQIGQTLFPIHSDATITCSFESVPDDLSYIKVGWYQTVGKNPVKIGSSSISSAGIYGTAPDTLVDRFVMSSDRFENGFADAIIVNVSVVDEASYACDVELLGPGQPVEQRRVFPVHVYSEPTVYIEEINTKFNLLPQVEEEEPALSENGTSVLDDMSTIAETTTPTTPVAEDRRLDDIVTCMVDYVYPIPTRIEFHGQAAGLLLSVDSNDFDTEVENEDMTYNVSAVLRYEVTSDLDGDVITCTSIVTDQNIATTSSTPSSPIIVNYATTSVDILISPSTATEDESVTISCEANGNPKPTLKLTTLEDGNGQDITDQPFVFLAKRDSPKRYKCTAYNNDQVEASESGEGVLIVNYLDAPVISGPEVAEGRDSVTLRCNAKSNAPTTYEWRLNGAKVYEREIYTITDAKASHSGIYRCTASAGSLVRSAEHNLDVKVECKPKLTYEVYNSTEVSGGTKVILTCAASGNPACEMLLLPPYEGIATEYDENEVTLTIPNLPMQIEPLEFTCTASNELSVTNATAKVTKSPACCLKPTPEGPSSGTIALIIIIVIIVIVAVLLAVYCLRKKKGSKKTAKNEQPIDDVEVDKLNKPAEELAIPYETHDDFRLNTAKPMRTFSQKREETQP